MLKHCCCEDALMKNKTFNNIMKLFIACCILIFVSAQGGEDYQRALKRAQHLLNGTTPTDAQLTIFGTSKEAYRTAVRNFINSDNFYNMVLRYHERVFGVGLPADYIKELLRDDIDNKANKFAKISCARSADASARYKCVWASEEAQSSNSCPAAQEKGVSVFWYPGIVAWVCPSIVKSCGPDLSRCFVEYTDQDEAKNSELGTTETFDSKFAVIKSLSRQAAGLATAITVENYPYTKILLPGVSAIDGSIAHFYRQAHHFRIDELKIPAQALKLGQNVRLANTRFRLMYTGLAYDQGGILSTFGWLRRYEKNRTRANNLYERLFCRKFTSQLPRLFPQDPGNLRTAVGCSGCHATLDPLADFFRTWGEGGEFYAGQGAAIDTTFSGQSGKYVSDLAKIVSSDQAFATCQVQHVFEWLMGRKFYHDEDKLRAALTNYFADTNYSMRELIYAVATHPAFTMDTRSDAVVTDPLEEPPLGQVAGEVKRECSKTYDYAADIAPSISMCTSCHAAGSTTRQDLTTKAQWKTWGAQAAGMMASGSMPPGQASSPEITTFKEAVRCWIEQGGI